MKYLILVLVLFIASLFFNCADPLTVGDQWPKEEVIDSGTSVIHTEDGEKIFLFKSEYVKVVIEVTNEDN